MIAGTGRCALWPQLADDNELGICNVVPARHAAGLADSPLRRQKIIGPSGGLSSEGGCFHGGDLSDVHMVSLPKTILALKRIQPSRKFQWLMLRKDRHQTGVFPAKFTRC
jgi:hypothetical protein